MCGCSSTRPAPGGRPRLTSVSVLLLPVLSLAHHSSAACLPSSNTFCILLCSWPFVAYQSCILDTAALVRSSCHASKQPDGARPACSTRQKMSLTIGLVAVRLAKKAGSATSSAVRIPRPPSF
eukprot:8407339-Karenia_brevis.AAC.1